MKKIQPKQYGLLYFSLLSLLPYSVQAAKDYGDAPAAYTQPYHTINGGIILGGIIDAEANTQSSDNADGDDNSGTSDEDGLVGTLPALSVGDTSYSVTVKVKNTSSDNAYLTAWIDFNKDNIFQYDEALNDNNVYVAPYTSENVTLQWDNSDNGYQFPIAEALVGDTILRVRLSTERLLRCDDEYYQEGNGTEANFMSSPDGEVEDYKLPIRGSLTNCFQIISADQSDPNTGDNSECVTITQTSGSSLPTPILNYHFDEDFWSGASADVLDNSGSGLHATAISGADTTNSGKINNAGSFNGSNQYVDMGDELNDVFGASSNSFTITAWVKPDSLSGILSNHSIRNTIFAKTSNGNNDNLQVGIHHTGQHRGKIRVYLDTEGKNSQKFFGNQDDITIDSWSFVAISYDGSTVKVHINDNVYNSGNTWHNGGNLHDASGSPFTIASSQHKKNNIFNYFDGNIDEVKIFSTTLTDDQIQEIYTNENAGSNYNGTTRAIEIDKLPVGTASARLLENDVIEWKSIWVNASVSEEPLVTIYSEVPKGTVLEEGSINCLANAPSHTTVGCYFEEPSEDYPRGKIIWTGVISLEPNPQLDINNDDIEAQAQNEVIIKFRSKAVANTNNENNTTLFHPSSAWDYDQDGAINRMFYANASGSNTESNEPVELALPLQASSKQFVQIPTVSEWGIILMSILMSLMGLLLYRRQS